VLNELSSETIRDVESRIDSHQTPLDRISSFILKISCVSLATNEFFVGSNTLAVTEESVVEMTATLILLVASSTRNPESLTAHRFSAGSEKHFLQCRLDIPVSNPPKAAAHAPMHFLV
jgi:hypothetical protein